MRRDFQSMERDVATPSMEVALACAPIWRQLPDEEQRWDLETAEPGLWYTAKLNAADALLVSRLAPSPD
jgi:hypothetical protein